jgi:hypothetical protein
MAMTAGRTQEDHEEQPDPAASSLSSLKARLAQQRVRAAAQKDGELTRYSPPALAC